MSGKVKGLDKSGINHPALAMSHVAFSPHASSEPGIPYGIRL